MTLLLVLKRLSVRIAYAGLSFELIDKKRYAVRDAVRSSSTKGVELWIAL